MKPTFYIKTEKSKVLTKSLYEVISELRLSRFLTKVVTEGRRRRATDRAAAPDSLAGGRPSRQRLYKYIDLALGPWESRALIDAMPFLCCFVPGKTHKTKVRRKVEL